MNTQAFGVADLNETELATIDGGAIPLAVAGVIYLGGVVTGLLIAR